MTKAHQGAPVVGEIAKVVKITGLSVWQASDGESICLRFPIDTDGNTTTFAVPYTMIDELLEKIRISAEEAAGTRARRAAGQ